MTVLVIGTGLGFLQCFYRCNCVADLAGEGADISGYAPTRGKSYKLCILNILTNMIVILTIKKYLYNSLDLKDSMHWH